MCPCTLDNCRRTARPGNCPWKPLPQLPDPVAEKPGCLDTSFQTQFRKVWRPQKTEKTDFFPPACDQEPLSEDWLHLHYGPPSCFPSGPLPDLLQDSLTFLTTAQAIPRYRQGHSRSARCENTPRSLAGLCWAFGSRCRSLTAGFGLPLDFSLRIVEKFA